jgi:hypothetical protein
MNRLVASILCLLLLSAAAVRGQENGAEADESAPPVVFPSIPAHARTRAGLVPAGWDLEMESRGDLNADGAPDLLLVLHMTDPRNVLTNRALGTRELDTNPRILVVAFADKAASRYSLALADHTLIPRLTNPFMDDPLDQVAVVKGTVQVSLSFWMSAGSWTTSQTTFTFRYQEGCFKLIGYDSTETRRNSGETSAVSVNYPAKRMKLTKGNIENERESVSWKSVRAPKLLCLNAVGDGLAFHPEN